MFYIHLWKYSPSICPCQLTQGKFYLGKKKKNVKALQSRKEGFLMWEPQAYSGWDSWRSTNSLNV